MRTFVYSDDRSHKFWNIEIDGSTVTVRYGRQGTDGQTVEKKHGSEAVAQKELEKLIASKVKKGYVETTPEEPTGGTGESTTRMALEKALFENPDDLATHMAYADYLSEQGDPRGELIQVQLALEDESHSAAQRKKLKKQEEKLLKEHSREWLGDLASWLLDQKGVRESYRDCKYYYRFSRGWLSLIEGGGVTGNFTARLAVAPEAKLLRELRIQRAGYELEDDEQEVPGIPGSVSEEEVALYPLRKSTVLKNVRVFQYGETIDWQNAGDHYNCHASLEGVVPAIKQMPNLEEIYLFCHYADLDELFGLRTLKKLRILLAYHMEDFPLSRLAKNPAMANLTHLLLYPHALTEEEPSITFNGLRAVLRSKHITGLTHLQLRQSGIGDKGCLEMVKSGIFKQLKFLDLRVGTITDEGAMALAECEDIRNLEYLNLSRNAIGEEALGRIQKKVKNLVAVDQMEWTGDLEDLYEMFYEGDYE